MKWQVRISVINMLSCTVQIFEIYFRPAKKIDKNSNVNFSHKHNVCFKKCSQVDIDGPWISSGLFYFLLAVLSDCIIRQILELYKHMRFAYSLLSQISSANGQPNSLMYLKLSGAFHVSLIYLFTATI